MSAVSPFLGRSVPWLLRTRAEQRPHHEALVWRDADGGREAWTYRELVDAVDRVAANFAARGVGVGTRVCIHADNCPEFILTWFALHTLGAVMVATNTRSTGAELARFLARADASLVVTQAGHAATVGTATGERSVPVVVIGSDAGPGATAFDALRAEPASPFVGSPVGPDHVAGIQFTSGTTAEPRGVVWTQGNYLWGAKVSCTHQRMSAAERTLTFLPLFHTNAQIYSVMATLWAGGTIVLIPRFSVSRFWPVALEERATWAWMIPFAVKALRTRPVPEDHTFRGWSNGLVVPGWERHYGTTTISSWGMTETVTTGVVSEWESPRRPLAIGYPALEYEIRLVDEAGAPIPAPGTGLVEIRGKRGLSLALEYLDDPEATAATWGPDGWMRTGDQVTVHEDGWVSFVGRAGDMLRVGVENVAALEIEQAVTAAGGIEEVAVVGAPHPMLDEVPVAFVIPRGDPAPDLVDRILVSCRERLSDFKVPRAVLLVDDLPRSTLEKVSKAELRRRAAELDLAVAIMGGAASR